MINNLRLLRVPLGKDYMHTLYFANATEQQNYFKGCEIAPRLNYDNFTYQRKDEIVRLPLHAEEISWSGINYCMYQNTEVWNKWYYAFVTDVKYVNDGCCELHIKTDCIQTWMFDIEIKPSFVEREHAKVDNAAENLLDEGVELGEYICNNHTKADYSFWNYAVIGYTERPDGTKATAGNITGIWSGMEYSAYDLRTAEAQTLSDYIKEFAEEGKADALQIMFMAPSRIVTQEQGSHRIQKSEKPHRLYINEINPPDAVGGTVETKNITFSTNLLDGYSPRNKKLLSFPFRYLLVVNNSGGSALYKYEKFYQKTSTAQAFVSPKFVIEGVVCPGCSIRLVPLDYKGASRNDEEGINMGKYPMLNWTSDAYTNWLTQNAVNIGLDIAGGVFQIGAGIASIYSGVGAGAGVGQIASGVSAITGTIAQVHTQSFTPDQAKGNLNAGDVITAAGENDFHFYDMSISAQYAKIIDDYFDMFGYKCHRVKIPEKNHRNNYWYTKTIDANITNKTGAVPQDDLQTIKDCYNRGITFWRRPANFGDYSAPNGIV